MSDVGTNDPNLKLARMAGQIADFYRIYPEAEAAASIAAHINKFWPRPMREALLGMKTKEAAQLDPLVRAARSMVRPPR